MTKAETIKVQAFLQTLDLYKGKVDGIAGPMTIAGIRLYQRANGLVEDGIAGKKTLGSMFPHEESDLFQPPIKSVSVASERFYKGAAKAIEPGDLERVAKDIKVEPRAFKAIVTVEAAGNPFDKAGRVTALYEPHIIYRYASVAVKTKLIAAKLAYAKWGTKPYPKTSDARFNQIDAATKIGGAELAFDATSWGMGQIIGFNARSAGYLTAVDMVIAFAADAENQIAAMGAFTLNNLALHRALQRKDWATVAELWNGAGFRKNRYDVRLADAYKRG